MQHFRRVQIRIVARVVNFHEIVVVSRANFPLRKIVETQNAAIFIVASSGSFSEGVRIQAHDAVVICWDRDRIELVWFVFQLRDHAESWHLVAVG